MSTEIYKKVFHRGVIYLIYLILCKLNKHFLYLVYVNNNVKIVILKVNTFVLLYHNLGFIGCLLLKNLKNFKFNV